MADAQMAIPDGAGGAFIAWRDIRAYAASGSDVYAQRITSSGTIAPGWPASGLPVCTATGDQTPESIAPDGRGGFLVSWYDTRNGGEVDVYAHRVGSGGSIALGWPPQGAPVSLARYFQGISVVSPDNTGGAYVAWFDERDYPTLAVDYYLQHLTSTGEVWPGWPPDGFAVAALPGNQGLATLVPDGTGGVGMAWTDVRRGIPDVYAQRILADGSVAPGWVDNGIPMLLDRSRSQVVPDHAGGFFVASGRLQCGCLAIGSAARATASARERAVVARADVRTAAHATHRAAGRLADDLLALGFDDGFYAQRVTFDGQIAAGWPVEGVTVCQLPDDRGGLKAVEDGRGGMLMAWYDYRVPGGDIFAARVLADATLGPGWPFQGLQVSDPLAPGLHYDPVIAADGAGGAYVAWEIQRFFEGVWERVIYAQHLAADGTLAPGWPFGGVRVTPRQESFHPVIVSDGAGGAIVIWDELGLYAQRYVADGPVGVQLTLASADAAPERVVLRWRGAGAGAISATVERRTEAGQWAPLGRAVLDGAEALTYEDYMVEPGARYAYRLAYIEQGATRHTAEFWVEVPRALRFAFEGFTPNPSSTPATVAFTLPDDAPATLEVFDIAGRTAMSLEVGALGAGHHQVKLDGSRTRSVGVYLVRLRRGDEVRVTRGAIVK